MNQQPISTPNTMPEPVNGEVRIVVQEQVSVAIEQSAVESEEERERKYQVALKKYEEGVEAVKQLRKELLETFHKSQDAFETQLSYIAAGSLALSIGFIKDIVTPIKASHYKWMLIAGWGALIATLLINLISHIIAGKHAKRGAKEAEDIENTYDPVKINRRAGKVEWLNWSTIGTLTGGIVLIVLYIILNAIL